MKTSRPETSRASRASLTPALLIALELVLEEVLGELRAVRAERVRLDQLGARADVAEVHVDDALRRTQVRLFRTAKAGHGAREQRAHAAVRDDRRARGEPLEEPRHARSLRSAEYGERGRRQPRSLRSRTSGAAPAASGPLNGCTLSIASGAASPIPRTRLTRLLHALKVAPRVADQENGAPPGD